LCDFFLNERFHFSREWIAWSKFGLWNLSFKSLWLRHQIQSELLEYIWMRVPKSAQPSKSWWWYWKCEGFSRCEIMSPTFLELNERKSLMNKFKNNRVKDWKQIVLR
jgi:hypothetical protein